MRQVSVIVPVYWNEESLPRLIEIIQKTVRAIQGYTFEFIFVDDGSGDRSFDVLLNCRKKDSRIKILKLTRNFGSHNAIVAGLGYARGNCYIMIGADLQDPPSVIPKFLREWEKEARIVVGIREHRIDPWPTIILSRYYHAIMRFTFKTMPKNGFNIFLIDKTVRNFLVSVGSRNMPLAASLLWTGYPAREVPYVRGQRPYGKSRWTFKRRIKLAVDSLTAYSYLPILFIFLIGLLQIFLAIPTAVILLRGDGSLSALHPDIFICFCVLGIGFNTLGLGILGEYLWRNLEATRRFPDYMVDREIGLSKQP